MRSCSVIEQLEARAFLAGNVEVARVHGITTISGDSLNNEFSIRSNGSGAIDITGANGTTINGLESMQIDNLQRPMKINVGDGNDILIIQGITLRSGMAVDTGLGDDIVSFANNSLYAVDIQMGDGNDRVGITNTSFFRRLRENLGAGRDRSDLTHTRTVRGFDLTDSGQGSKINLNAVESGDQSWISTGGGDDLINIDASNFNAFSVKTKGGDDISIVRRTVFSAYSPIDLGAGQNTLDRQIISKTDFADNDTHGWNVQSYGRDPALYNTYVTLEEYQSTVSGRKFGILPIETALDVFNVGVRFQSDLSGGVFAVQNIHEFVAVVKELGAADGISPNQRYQITFDMKIVVESSGASFSAGASNIFPNLDLLVSGETKSYSYPGDDDNRINPIITDEENNIAIVRRVSEPAILTTKSDGKLWLVVGADVAPENQASYAFREIKATITPIP